jgi:hypothetical protein
VNVSAPEYFNVEHFGGPYDGQTHRVPAEDGLPPEYATVADMTATDYSIDPASGPASQIATQFYERDITTRDDKICWVYVWKGETVTDAAA